MLKEGLSQALQLTPEQLEPPVLGYRDSLALVSQDVYKELLADYRWLAEEYQKMWDEKVLADPGLDDSYPSL